MSRLLQPARCYAFDIPDAGIYLCEKGCCAMPPDLLPLAIAAFLIAGTVKGALGIGLPVTALGILALFVDPRIAVSLAILPILAANVWQTLRMGDTIGAIRRYWLWMAAMGFVLIFTISLLRATPVHVIEAMLGIMILIFALTNLTIDIPRIPDRYDRISQAIAGAASGVFGGMTGLWGPPLFIYLTARRIDKDEFVRATGILLLLGGLPVAFGYWRAGYLPPIVALNSLLLIIPTLAGFYIGEQIRRRIDSERFRTATLFAFLLIGLNLLRAAIF